MLFEGAYPATHFRRKLKWRFTMAEGSDSRGKIAAPSKPLRPLKLLSMPLTCLILMIVPLVRELHISPVTTARYSNNFT